MAAAFVAVVVLIGVISGYVFWWSKPTVFGGWGNEVGGSLEVGQTLNVGMAWASADEAVSLHRARAVIMQNSADAQLDFVVCRQRSDGGVGAVTEPLSDYCSTVSPVSGHHLPAFSPSSRESIILRITPRKTGRIVLHGMRLDYGRGMKHVWQTGTEQTGMGIDVTVP